MTGQSYSLLEAAAAARVPLGTLKSARHRGLAPAGNLRLDDVLWLALAAELRRFGMRAEPASAIASEVDWSKVLLRKAEDLTLAACPDPDHPHLWIYAVDTAAELDPAELGPSTILMPLTPLVRGVLKGLARAR